MRYIGRKQLVYFSVITLFTLFAVDLSHQVIAETTPTPTHESSYWIPPPIGLPNIECPIFKVIGRGPIWKNLAIGLSSVTDINTLINQVGKYEKSVSSQDINANSVHYSLENPDASSLAIAPLDIDVCFQDGVLTVVSLVWVEKQPPLYLHDIVEKNGVPDSVTWTPSPKSRIAFWFNKGMAVEVFVGVGDRNSFGRVFSEFYFPYQEITGYENRWPFNKTWPTEHEEDGDRTPTEQNPFDFATMLRTITASPPRQATPTISLSATETKTP